MVRADDVAAEQLFLKPQRLAQASGKEIEAGIEAGVGLWIMDPDVEGQVIRGVLRRRAADRQGGRVEMQPLRQW